MSTMEAYRWIPGATTLQKQTVPIPVPGDDQVLIKVLAAGLCHSDLLYYQSEFDGTLPASWPFTMGHEGAGIITAMGTSVSSLFPSLELNQYVAIHGINPCHLATCPNCSIGGDNMCSTYPPIGLGADGSFAEYVAVNAKSVVPVGCTPQKLAPEKAAVATDAVLTCYHALKTGAGIKEGQTVLVLGVGGLGTNGIQIAKNVLGAKCVIGCDTRQASLTAAKEIGADYVVTPEELPSLIKDKNLLIDVACDFVGIQSTFDAALASIKPRGMIMLVGLSSPKVDLTLLMLASKDASVKGSMWGTKEELKEVLKIVREGKVVPIVATRPLAECVEALEDLRNGRLNGRVAVVPS